MSTPLSPRRSRICGEISNSQPCEIRFSYRNHSVRTEIDNRSDIEKIFSEAITDLEKKYRVEPSKARFVVGITASKGEKILWGKAFEVYPKMPEIPFCESEED